MYCRGVDPATDQLDAVVSQDRPHGGGDSRGGELERDAVPLAALVQETLHVGVHSGLGAARSSLMVLLSMVFLLATPHRHPQDSVALSLA